MSVTAGDKLGPYEILDRLGHGGMGEVWRARDTRLNREVAVKVSADRFSDRFEREARAVAALNHSNICTLHDVGPNYLVMELVEGPTLAERIDEGPMPLDEALTIARQIGDALEAAHEKGIVHRDLKPANVKVRPDGTVKILDFGLAKALGTDSLGASDVASSPTITSPAMTQQGLLLGTAGYMAPEQARGKAVDKRADIFAFGVVLYEMLVGKRLFNGETMSDTLAAILREEPNLSAVPGRVRPLLRRCLEKDPKQRLHDIADARLWLEEAPVETTVPAVDRPSQTSRPWLWVGVATVATLAAGVLAIVHFREQGPPDRAVVRFHVPFPPGEVPSQYLSLSPNGRQIAFTTTNNRQGGLRLWVRDLDSLESRMLAGTDGARDPFWSPDGRFLAFKTPDKLKKVAVAGGPPVTLCDAPGTGFAVGDWNDDGVILFASTDEGLMRVPAAGGVPVAVTKATAAVGFHRRPTFLPDGRQFVYFQSGLPGAEGNVMLGSLDLAPEAQPTTPLLTAPYAPIFVPVSDRHGGRLLFLREGTLFAQAFDVNRRVLVDEAWPIAEDVSASGTYGMFTASDDGVLAYRGGSAPQVQATWFDRQGARVSTVGDPGAISNLALSPDGRKLATSELSESGEGSDIWIRDLERGTRTRFTFDAGAEINPAWSPDGSTLAFTSRPSATSFELVKKLASGAGQPETLFSGREPIYVDDWSKDGRFLLFTRFLARTGSDLWVVPLDGDRKPQPFLTERFNQGSAQFSPDGRWITFTSLESGRAEVFIRPFPATAGDEGKFQISNAGGGRPLWKRDGKELFYISSAMQPMAVDVNLGPSFSLGTPKALFAPPSIAGAIQARGQWDVSTDGQRFLMLAQAGQSVPNPISIVLNWTAEPHR